MIRASGDCRSPEIQVKVTRLKLSTSGKATIGIVKLVAPEMELKKGGVLD